MHFLRRDSVLLRGSSDNASSLAPDSPEFRMQSPTARDFRLQQWWLIDPKLLFVGRRIGEGAHAKVYEGKYCDQSVAVKIIRAGDTAEEAAKREARFNREVSMLSKVQHRNLVRFIGACKDPVMVVVTEHLQGGSLRKYLMELRPQCLDLHVAVGFALDIAQAMDCLHNNGIIHRDLKPENLIITSDHKTVKLVDLGLAREETLTEMMTAETGTYRWMAPELYSTVTLRHGEKKHYNHKVDVYSFSIVLWELLTNRMPFEGMSNLQAAYAAAFKGSRPSLSGDLDLPEDLILLMQSCWAEDPNARPNFAQIVRALNALMVRLSAPERVAPPLQMLSRNLPSAKGDDSPSTSSTARLKPDEQSETSTPTAECSKPRGFPSCFSQCFLSGAGEPLM